jgi:alkylated DNA repair protein alkB family protein 1
MHQQNDQVAQIWSKASRQNQDIALNKLHWAALGYHYDWTARQYHDGNFSQVPFFLQDFGAKCAQACGMTLKAEAVIVNFYKKNSTMGGHQDDVEYTMENPVVSLSLGAEAIFLKGSTTKQDKPLQIRLRSGDIAIMGGNSRLSFHGIAKIIPSQTSFSTEEEEKEKYQDIVKYLETHRININLRQVYPSTKRAKKN